MDLTALSVLLTISFPFSLEHHVLLPYRIGNINYATTINFPFIFSGNLFSRNNSSHFLNLTKPIPILAVTASSQPTLAFCLSPKKQNIYFLFPLHQSRNLSIKFTIPSIISLHFELTTRVANLEVTLYICISARVFHNFTTFDFSNGYQFF